MKRLPNLNWLRTFEAAARHASFTAASHELGLTQTAVSLQIKSLETKLGYDLFVRKPRNIHLTELGEAYLPSVRKALDELTQSTNGLFGPVVKRTITLRAPISTAVLWLAPQLHDFKQKNPEIALRIVTNIWADSIADTNVDVDIRMGSGTWPGMRCEKLSDEMIVPICAKENANRVTSVSDLRDGPLIHILGYDDHWSRYFGAFGLPHDPDKVTLSVDTSIAAFELVAAGAGYAAVISRFAQGAINAGRSIEQAGDPITFDQSHYIVESLASKRAEPEVEKFKSWLREMFSASKQTD